MKKHTIIVLIAAFFLGCAICALSSQKMGLAIAFGVLEVATIIVGIQYDSKSQHPMRMHGCYSQKMIPPVCTQTGFFYISLASLYSFPTTDIYSSRTCGDPQRFFASFSILAILE